MSHKPTISTIPNVAVDGVARKVMLAITVALGYFCASELGLALIEPSTQVAVVWLAAGVGLGALLLVPQRAWPIVLAGLFVGNLGAQLLVRGTVWMSAALATVNAVAPLSIVLALALIERITTEPPSPSQAFARLLLAISSANAVSSLAGAAILNANFDAPFASTLLAWYLSDALGFLLVAPLVVAFRQSIDRVPRPRTQAITGVATAVLAVVVFFPTSFGIDTTAPLPILLMPVLLWTAIHVGLRLTSVLMLVVGIIGAFAGAHGRLPFMATIDDAATQLAAYQLFIAVVIVCTMFVSAVVVESYSNERSARLGRERVESILRALTESAVIGMSRDTGQITFFNVGAERLLGYSASDIVGRRSACDLHVDDELDRRRGELDLAEPWAALTALASRGQPETRRWTYRRSDGSTVRVMLTITAEHDLDGELTGYIGIARDLTEQEDREREIRDSLIRERSVVAQLRAANKARSDFVSTVSHELRTPLTNVVGFTEMLQTGDFGELTAPQTRAVSRIDHSGRRLLDLVDDLLTLNGMDVGQFAIEETDVDFVPVLKGAVNEVALVADRSNVALTLSLDAEAVVCGDAKRLEQMLLNVIANAVKFTPEGGAVDVALTVDSVARVVVTDTGIGIPDDEIGQVFERFFRANHATQQAVPGSGLGLPIARSIAEVHGGSIELASEFGVGTTVTIELPARLPAGRRSATVTLAGAGASQQHLGLDNAAVGGGSR